MTNPQNLEPRLTQTEQSIEGLQSAVSELRSTVSTLADLVQIQADESAADRAEARAAREVINRQFEESRQRFDRFVEQAEQDRALMLQLIQAIAQGRNGEIN